MRFKYKTANGNAERSGMTVHSFPNMPLRTPVRELGISDIPIPPPFAIRDMERAHDRFLGAMIIEQSAALMPPQVAQRARLDRKRHMSLVNSEEVDGIRIVDPENVLKFIHYITGHPKAWVLAWQLHSFAGSLMGHQVDREAIIPAFAEQVREVAHAFSDGFNREL
jgi:hypothetical protein